MFDIKVNNKKQIYTIIFIITFLVYVIFTLKFAVLSGRIPNKDEAHAWLIAGHLNVFQIIDLMKYEGHFLLWYLLIKPFANSNSFYPLPMQIINWLFMVGAVAILWLKAPFNTISKIFITFTAPFFRLYPVYARCYSIGIFFLFLSMSLYKDRLKHPYLYLLLLVLCANTNLIMCFIACVMGCMFLYDLFKNKVSKKIILITIFITSINIILWIIQFCPIYIPEYTAKERITVLAKFFGFYLLNTSEFVYYSIFRLIVLTYFVLIYKSKKIFWITLTIFLLYSILFLKIYNVMHDQHIWLLYIIFLFSYWLFKLENYKNNALETLLIIISACFIFFPVNKWNGINSTQITFAKNINIFWNNIDNVSPLPYLEKNNVHVYDFNGEEVYTINNAKKIYNKTKKYDIDKIAQIIKENDLIILNKNAVKLQGRHSSIYLKDKKRLEIKHIWYVYNIDKIIK